MKPVFYLPTILIGRTVFIILRAFLKECRDIYTLDSNWYSPFYPAESPWTISTPTAG